MPTRRTRRRAGSFNSEGDHEIAKDREYEPDFFFAFSSFRVFAFLFLATSTAAAKWRADHCT